MAQPIYITKKVIEYLYVPALFWVAKNNKKQTGKKRAVYLMEFSFCGVEQIINEIIKLHKVMDAKQKN